MTQAASRDSIATRARSGNCRARPRTGRARWSALLALVVVATLVGGCGSSSRKGGWSSFGFGGSSTPSGPPQPGDLVDLATIDPSIVVEMRYATTNNFTGVAVYPVGRCVLRRDIAERLQRVQSGLRARGFGLKVWDCYRPISVQQKFWALVPDARYVAQPVVHDGKPIDGSKHNRGAAVDLTLVDAASNDVPMPTDYDDFSDRASRTILRGDGPSVRNMRILEVAMVREGFEPLPTEWWHFDGPGWEKYELSDVPLD